jgi:subtilisin family serine protease
MDVINRNILLLLLALPIMSWSSDLPQPSFVPGQVIVKFKQAHASAMSAASLQGYTSTGLSSIEPVLSRPAKRSNSSIDPRAFYVVNFSKDIDPQSIARELAVNSQVEYAQPNYIYTVQALPNDPNFSSQSFWQQIQAPQAWDVTKGDSSVIIAVLDTGVDYNHEDLKDNIWINRKEKLDGIDNDGNGYIDDIRGWDFVSGGTNVANGEDGTVEDNDPMDVHGHGTHVAGLASAVTNNGVGVAGAGWNCRIMPLRVGYKTKDNNGSISTSAVLNAINYAVSKGAKVINASFGGPFNDYTSRDMMRYAFENGVVVVKAAGNSNSDIAYSPDNEDFVLSVTAVDFNDQKASYSSYGTWAKITAPGGTSGNALYSTLPNNRYGAFQGTSMAAAIVSGVAGLVRSVHPDWTAAQVMMHIVDTADNIDAVNPQFAGLLGDKGRVNAFRAVTAPFSSTPDLRISRISIEDMVSGNSDQRANIGETTDLLLRVTNVWNTAENVQLVLSTSDPQVTVIHSALQYAKIPGISSSPNFVDTRDPYFSFKVDERAFPHNIQFVLTATAGSYVQVINFHVAIEARVLFVDDDDGSRNVEEYYYSVLDSIGMPYDVWDRSVQGRASARLKNYNMVIWSCENAFPTLDNYDREDLTNYLRNNKFLMVTGQNIGWDLAADQTSDDALARNYYNQYRLYGFDARSFYESLLHALYVDDNSSYGMVRGVDDSPISRGLEFAFAEPLRQSDEQSPDVIAPTKGGKTVFTYPGGRAAAVYYYTDTSKVLNCAFGGLEAIPDEVARRTLMSRILSEFTGLEVVVNALQNVESPNQDMFVGAKVKSRKELQGVYLYWRKTSDSFFHQVVMTAVNDTTYYADIPRQTLGSEIEYGAQAVATDSIYSPIKLMTVKIESTPPAVFVQAPHAASLVLSPIVSMTAFDISGLNAGSAMVHFWTTSAKDSLALDALSETVFSGRIRGNFNFGDVLHYQFSIRDRSLLEVRGVSPVYDMLLGFEGFESGLDAWQTTPGGWGLEKIHVRSGLNAVHESPGQGVNYPNNADLSLALKYGLDLSRLSQATLSAWMFYKFNDTDYGSVEASNDSGLTWQPLSLPISGSALKYYQAEFDLQRFTGPGNNNVLLRFRVISNEAGSDTGWYIDDVEILPIRTQVAQTEEMIPATLALSDAYPNPFNSRTIVSYALPAETFVRLTVLNTLGQEVTVLENQRKPAGRYSVTWDGLDAHGIAAPSGIYFCRLLTDNQVLIKKMTLLR